MQYFGPVNRGAEPAAYRAPCELAYDDFLAWKRAHKIPSSQRKFSYWCLFKDEYGTYLNSKGFNSRVISAWLEDLLERVVNGSQAGLIPDQRAYLSLVALNPSLDQTFFCV